MHLYNVGNVILHSNVVLPGLIEIDRGIPHYSFYLQLERIQEPASLRWFHHWQGSDQDIWTLFARHESGYLVRFPDLADFYLSSDSVRIDCYPDPETPLDTIGHLLLDQVIPIVLSRLDGLVVHASAVATPMGAIAFVGNTGRGKSTMAASLALQGFPLITDDCLLLHECNSVLIATPSYPGARLWDDSIETLFKHAPSVSNVAHYTNKKRLALNEGQLHFTRDPIPLRRMYFLGDPEQLADTQKIEITPLSVREAFMELISYSFKLDVHDPQVLQREFRLLNRVAPLSLFYRLSYPHDFSMLSAVQTAILEHVCG